VAPKDNRTQHCSPNWVQIFWNDNDYQLDYQLTMDNFSVSIDPVTIALFKRKGLKNMEILHIYRSVRAFLEALLLSITFKQYSL